MSKKQTRCPACGRRHCIHKRQHAEREVVETAIDPDLLDLVEEEIFEDWWNNQCSNETVATSSTEGT